MECREHISASWCDIWPRNGAVHDYNVEQLTLMLETHPKSWYIQTSGGFAPKGHPIFFTWLFGGFGNSMYCFWLTWRNSCCEREWTIRHIQLTYKVHRLENALFGNNGCSRRTLSHTITALTLLCVLWDSYCEWILSKLNLEIYGYLCLWYQFFLVVFTQVVLILIYLLRYMFVCDTLTKYVSFLIKVYI